MPLHMPEGNGREVFLRVFLTVDNGDITVMFLVSTCTEE